MKMLIKPCLCVVLLLVLSTANSKPAQSSNWAVLLAGSSEYYNYRHQADICHAFQDLRAHGIPESNIIVMMADDIAESPDNPTKGIIVNQPNGNDVYKGVPKDWTRDEVTPENFIAVLLGDEEAARNGKKVLRSGPNDNVFIYFADHGGPGIISFPNDILESGRLISTLNKMHEKKMYNKLVFYMEACESGSMFEDLPSDISIYATTAANSEESSYACFYDPSRKTFLGDEYSVNWLLDSDVGKRFGNETLAQQFLRVKRRTIDSHPQQFGDLSMKDLPISEFQGSKVPEFKPNPFTQCDSQTESFEVPKEILLRRIAGSSGEERKENEKKLKELEDGRRFLEKTVRKIVENLCKRGFCVYNEQLFTQKSTKITRRACYEDLLRTFHKHCFNLGRHSYAVKHLRVFLNIVEGMNLNNVDKQCSNAKPLLEKLCHRYASSHSYTRIQ